MKTISLFFLCNHIHLIASAYNANTFLSLHKKYFGIILGIENTKKKEFSGIVGLDIDFNTFGAQLIINNNKEFNFNLIFENKDNCLDFLLGLRYSFKTKQIMVAIGLQIKYHFSKNIKLKSSLDFNLELESINQSNTNSNRNQNSEFIFNKKKYGIVNEVIDHFEEQHNEIKIPIHKKNLFEFYTSGNTKEEQKQKKIYFYNIFHYCYQDLIFLIQENINQSDKEIKDTLRVIFIKIINELAPIIIHINKLETQKNNPYLKQFCNKLYSNKIQTKNFFQKLDFCKLINKEMLSLSIQKYIKETENIKIQKKTEGTDFKITNLHCDYNPEKNDSFFNFFSYPTIESSKDLGENHNLKEKIIIKQAFEYEKKKSKYDPYLSNHQKIQIYKKKDILFNCNLILKNVLLEFVPKIIYAYCNIDHSILVIEDQEKCIQYDSNKIVINNFYSNLQIQTGSNCNLYVLFLAILTKFLENQEDAIKVCVELNQLYNSDKENEVIEYVFNILNFNKLTNDKIYNTISFCKEILKTAKKVKNIQFQRKKHFGDLLRRQIVKSRLAIFPSDKETIINFKNTIKTEKNILYSIIFILNKPDLKNFLDTTDWTSINITLKNLIIQFQKILKISCNESESEYQNLYKETFDNSTNLYHSFLADHLITVLDWIQLSEINTDYIIIYDKKTKIEEKLANLDNAFKNFTTYFNFLIISHKGIFIIKNPPYQLKKIKVDYKNLCIETLIK